MTIMEYLEIAGMLAGIVYLLLQYKYSIWLWPAGIIMSVLYIIIFYKSGIYADTALYVYYLIAGIYGWILWFRKKESSDNNNLKIRHVTVKTIYISIASFVIIFILIYWILISFTNSQVPLCDSFTTALSVIGMVLLAKKYIEHWIIWIIVDIVSAMLYVYKDLYFTSLLFFIYTIVAVAGYFKWKKIGNL